MILLIINLVALSDDYGRVSGVVKCGPTHEPLVAVNVYLKNTHIGSATDENGIYCIQKIPPGKYEIIVEMIGFSRLQRKFLEINSGENLILDFILQPQAITYDNSVTVTATRGHSLITEVPSSVNVIDKQELELKNPQNLAEALQNVPGVTIKDYGGLGNTKSISLRGSSDSQVLILLDGQRLNSPQSGSVDLNQISLEGIEKIEVVRGGNSALYGSDAIGGVINIISKKTDPDEQGVAGDLKFGVASFGTYTAEPSLRFYIKNSGITASYKYLSSKGEFSYTDNYGNPATRVNSDIISRDYYLGLIHEFGDPHYQRNLSLTFKHYDSAQGAPGTIEPYYYHARMWHRDNKISAVYTGKIFNLFHNLRFQSYYYDSWYKYKNDETTGGILSKYSTQTYGNEIQFNSVIGPQVSLTYGSGFRYDQNRDIITQDFNKQTSYYLFAVNESVICINSLLQTISLVPSLRFDTDSKYMNHIVSPKLGAIFNFGEAWQSSLKLNISKSYRAPTFNDLYWPDDDPFSVGNPELEPEYGTDWDVGIRLQYPILNGIYFESCSFESNMTNLIIWQQIEKWMPLNVDKSRNRGIENSLKISPIKGLLDISANYMYLDARNLSGSNTTYNKILVYRPKHTVNFSATMNLKAVHLNYQYSYISRRFADASNTWGNSLEPYSVSDITVNYDTKIMKTQMNYSFQVKNIFDHEYKVIKNMPVPGREYRFSVKISI
ncbi:MAG: TonB-dependent receptor [Candidatus Marinimicrobia bacterium]|nr:TonB-dependent receptor [Candidatus Neomarinimicrobiota bacterium]